MIQRAIACVALATAGLLGLPAALTGGEPANAKPPQPLPVVARGKDYLVHSLGGGFQGPPEAFLHTTPSTGELRILWLTPRAGQFSHAAVVVLGYAADRERLYVAARSSRPQFAPGSGLPTAPEVKYHLYAFWLEDGSELTHKEWEESEVPKGITLGKPIAVAGPPRLTEAGPITLTEGGVECFAVTLTFDGKKLVAPAPKK